MPTMTDDEKRTCERCNAEIPPARVKVLPGTWLCIECSQEVGGDFVLIAKQENLGKAGQYEAQLRRRLRRDGRRTFHKKEE